MNSAQYYLLEMSDYSQLKRRYLEQSQEYKEYAKKLGNLISDLKNCIQYLKDSESEFLNGAFVVDGVSLDNGSLKDSYTKLEEALTDLEDAWDKTKEKDTHYLLKSLMYEDKYEEAQENYYKALKEE